jgi:hypothetical protein
MINGNKKDQKPETRRCTFTVSVELYNIMNRLKDVTGKPLTFFPSHVLEESIDVFETLVLAHETAITDKAKAIEQVEAVLAKKMVIAARTLTDD